VPPTISLSQSASPYCWNQVAGIEVSEGLLDDAELADLKRSLNEKELAALTQQKIAVPLVTTERDELLISILRSPLTQNLTFPDRASRHLADARTATNSSTLLSS
jgi:hypothetical protein